MRQKQQIQHEKRIPTQYLFLINGISSLLGYNALLSSLDYFNFIYEGYDVFSLFLPPVSGGFVLIVLLYRWLSFKFSYRALVTTGIILCNLSLVILLLFSIFFRNQKTIGFFISLFACFLLGVGSNLFELTFFAEINYLSESVVSKFTVGKSTCGVGITALRLIIVSIAGTDNSQIYPIISYFMVAILFNFFTLFCNLTFFSSHQFRTKILPHLNKQKQEIRKSLLDQNKQKNSSQKHTQSQNLINKAQNNNEHFGYFKLLYRTSTTIFPFPIILFMCYIMTFLVFPKVVISKKFDELQFVWSGLIFLLIYHTGDTIGRLICDLRWTFNKLSLYYMFFGRSCFVVIITLLATDIFNNENLINNLIFPYLLQFLFSLTNGFVTNASFILSYEKCPVKYKKYAGVLGGIMLQVGILIGTNLAIPFSDFFVSDS